MTKKRVVLESIAFCLVTLLLFVAAFLSFFFASRNALHSEIEDIVTVAENIFDGSEKSGEGLLSYFDGETDYRVSVIQKDGTDDYTILYDSEGLYLSSEKATELVKENLGTFVTRKSSYGYPMVYYAVQDSDAPDYFIRVAIPEDAATRVSRDFLIYGSVVLAILLLAYAIYKYRNYLYSIKPLRDQVERLLYLAGASSEKLGQGDDMSLITEAIDDVSSELDRKIGDLEKEKEKTKTILDSINQGFLVLSDDGKIVLFNRKVGSLFGYTEKEALHKDFHILSAGDEFSRMVERCLKDRKDSGHIDITVAGRIYQCDIMSLEEDWIDGSSGGAAILFLDVTEERNLVRIKTDFFANASHELKTPLTAILGYQEMMDAGLFTTEAEKKDAVERTIHEAKKMKEMLSDMLTISRLENGQRGEKEEFDLSDLIRHLLEEMEVRIAKRHIQLDLRLQPYPITAVKGDMEKIFGNLIDNAIKYNKDGGTIRIVMDPERQSVEVSDTGIGIKPENLSRIFERFYRVDNSKTLNNVEGTGLGLSIVKHIAQSSGYRVNVRSVYGQGTTFVVRT